MQSYCDYTAVNFFLFVLRTTLLRVQLSDYSRFCGERRSEDENRDSLSQQPGPVQGARWCDPILSQEILAYIVGKIK